MIKIQKIVTSITCLVMASMLSGCKDRPKSNIEEAEKVAMSYMENKYNKTFILNSCNETNFSFDKESVYIQARMKLSDSYKEYFVDVKPSFTDEDKDGFYDSYEVVSDDYMCDIIEPMIKEDMDNILREAGFNSFISSVDQISQDGIGNGGHGLLSDFPVITNHEFDLTTFMHNFDFSFFYLIGIPISASNDQTKSKIIDSFSSLVSNDLIFFHVYTYSDEDFVKINEHKNDRDFNFGEYKILDELRFDLS